MSLFEEYEAFTVKNESKEIKPFACYKKHKTAFISLCLSFHSMSLCNVDIN